MPIHSLTTGLGVNRQVLTLVVHGQLWEGGRVALGRGAVVEALCVLGQWGVVVLVLLVLVVVMTQDLVVRGGGGQSAAGRARQAPAPVGEAARGVPPALGAHPGHLEVQGLGDGAVAEVLLLYPVARKRQRRSRRR